MIGTEGTAGGYGGIQGSGAGSEDSDPLGYEARELGVTTYDSVTACAITLNYIIGTGCFGLPMAFYQVRITLMYTVCHCSYGLHYRLVVYRLFGRPLVVMVTRTLYTQGGLVFGTLLLVLGCLVMFVSATYVLENMARTRGILMARGQGLPENFIGYIKYVCSP